VVGRDRKDRNRCGVRIPTFSRDECSLQVGQRNTPLSQKAEYQPQGGVNLTHLVIAEPTDAISESDRIYRCCLLGKYLSSSTEDFHLWSKGRRKCRCRGRGN
jgi:hypothetical protein